MRSRAFTALVAGLVIAAEGCGGDDRPLRIGVVVDCVGIARSLHDAELSGAQMPLLERGARRRGAAASDGVTAARVAGRPVELVPACTEAFEFSMLTHALRRLVEVDRVDAVVAGGTGPDEIVLRDVARRHPDATFVPVVHGPREVTLHRSSPNVFRLAADYAQGVAGLASYAYKRLGWRRAAVVLADWDAGWLSRDAFVAEFCALGGVVSRQIALAGFDAAGRDVRRVPRDVDGVAVFAGQFFGPGAFLNALARRVSDPAGKIVVGPVVVDEPQLLQAVARSLDGVVASSHNDPSTLRRYRRAYERRFPGVPAGIAGTELVTGYHDAVEALLQAFERADGDVDRLPAELARLRVALLGGPVRLDGNRQAVAATTIVRIRAGAGRTGQPALMPIQTVRGVDQSLDGLLPRSLVPSDRPAVCRSGRPPAWAR